MAYGQTGTGKTYTMGMTDVPQDVNYMGMLPRTLDVIFSFIDQQKSQGSHNSWSVRISCLQIYLDQVNDLMGQDKKQLASKLQLRDLPEGGGVSAANLTSYTVDNAVDAYNLILDALKHRETHATVMNETSSRSHTIVTLEITQTSPSGAARQSLLRFVDLAGSERVAKTKISKERVEEAKEINKSLTVLGNVVASLAENSSSYIRYRDSKLTRVLQDSLSGNSRTCVIATVSPTVFSRSETLSTLMFAKRCMKVQTYAYVNEVTDYKKMAETLQRQLSEIHKYYKEREEAIVQQYEQGQINSNNNDGNGVNGIQSENIQSKIAKITKEKTILPQDDQNAAANNFSNNTDIAWSIVTIVYDALKQIEQMTSKTIDNIQEERNKEGNNWESLEKRKVEDLTSKMLPPFESLPEIHLNTAIDRIRSQNNKVVQEAISEVKPELENRESITSNDSKNTAKHLSSMENIEEFMKHMDELHASVTSNTANLTRILKDNEKTVESLKEQALDNAINKKLHNREIDSWNKILKSLLSKSHNSQ
eukprot:gb/GECH01001618.1/.p1 GENE.gb/GECH01001618.1/~~gb/GECH01001618.1/.p1  ORF type:complete len:536 (+),score=150.93 gb/GECH01001618.1/:1-1608(+)